MKIAIFANIYRPIVLNHLRVIFDYLHEKNVIILLNPELYDYINNHQDFSLENIMVIESVNFEADFALSIGGDGTFLNTAAAVGAKKIPILGVNTGRLGFLADIATENILPALEALLNSDFQTEERTLLHIEASDDTKFDFPYALNEISILKQDSSSMISINTHLNGEAIHTYQADGLLIATPTGSTAYSLSVGGPIVVPQAQNILLSPVASHSLTVRPLIVPDDWIIELEVKSRSHCYQISLDGRTIVVGENTKLKISKADFKIQVVKVLNQTFFITLKNKLMWGMDKRNNKV
jgi:NAD+ kinase